jgi:predicted nuclease of restriction endonuclease-like (RecB) superfamily
VRNQNYTNRQSITGDLIVTSNSDDFIDLTLLSQHMMDCNVNGFFPQAFVVVGYTHHSEIIAKEKSLEGRLFYIYKCAEMFWTVEKLKSNLRGELFNKAGKIPSNFALTIPEIEQAKRATRVFKDEYFLDFINIEDEDDPEERVLEQEIINNVRKFVLTFGDYFVPVGKQYRVIIDEEEFYTDLLFFNRELRCLVAIELKRGKFRPAHLGYGKPDVMKSVA